MGWTLGVFPGLLSRNGSPDAKTRWLHLVTNLQTRPARVTTPLFTRVAKVCVWIDQPSANSTPRTDS